MAMSQLVTIISDYAWLIAATAIVSGAVGRLAHNRIKRTGRRPTAGAILDAVSRVWVGATILGVAGLTLRPIGAGSGAGVNLVPLASIKIFARNSVDFTVAFRNLAGNVLLFIPIGFSLLVMWRNRNHPVTAAVAGGFALSLLIEITQYLIAVGRVVDVDDLILNTVGTWLGAASTALAIRLIGGLWQRRDPATGSHGEPGW